ncbi:MAG: transcriptional regulator [Anaerolineae bacterium]|nr:transcriptional regulator [Anaerolineae bacterium]
MHKINCLIKDPPSGLAFNPTSIYPTVDFLPTSPETKTNAGGDQHASRPGAAKNATRSTRYLHYLAQRHQQASFERQPALAAQIDDFDWQNVKKYVADNAARLNTDSVEEALFKRGCLLKDEQGRPYPTNAGLLLFGRDPAHLFPSAEIIAVCYQGCQADDPLAREDIRGPLPTQIRQAEAFVLKYLTPNFHLQNLEWTEQPGLPLDVVREVMINAVAHRAYDIRGDSARLSIFADRLECYSPGRLPGQVTVDNLLVERFSRNETMAQVLAEMGFMERLGAGLDRVVRRMAEEGLPGPRFEETAAGFKVTLFSQPAAVLAGQPDVPSLHKWLAQGLSARQIKLMNFVWEKGRLAHSDYGQLCPDVAGETLQRDLAHLVQRDLLLRVGDNGGTYYILK